MVFFHLWFDMLAFSWLVVHLRISVLWPRNWHFRHSIFLILRLCGCIFFVVSIHHFSLLPSQIMKRCTVLLFLFLILSHRFCLSLQSWKCMPLSGSLSLFIPLLRHCSPFSGLLSDDSRPAGSALHQSSLFLLLPHSVSHSEEGTGSSCWLQSLRTLCAVLIWDMYWIHLLPQTAGWLYCSDSNILIFPLRVTIQIVKFSTSYTNFYLHIPVFIFHAFVS